jgi:hypothetical protein
MSVCDQDILLFQEACTKIIHQERERNGIGTLSEKTVHAVLKNFYEPDADHQEIPVENFVADILRDDEIIEIQTRGFDRLRRKLDTFLKYYPVTVVYPILRTKWLYWIDEETGELSPKRKSPKKGTIYDAIPELYKIKMYLNHPNLHLCLVLIDAEEYRLLNGWSRDRKKGSSRYDRIPTGLVDEFYIGTARDYQCFIPEGLGEGYTSKDFAKAAHIPTGYARTTLGILLSLGLVERTGKAGRAYTYSTRHWPAL